MREGREILSILRHFCRRGYGEKDSKKGVNEENSRGGGDPLVEPPDRRNSSQGVLQKVESNDEADDRALKTSAEKNV